MNVRLLTLVVALILVSVACSSEADEATVVPTSTPVADGGNEATVLPTDTPVTDDTDGGDEPTAAPTDTPATNDTGGDEGTVTPANTGTDAVIAYVTETGLDGVIYEIAQPTNCKAIVTDLDRESANGKVCIQFANSSYSATSGTVEVGVFGTQSIWELTLEVQGGVWVVTDIESTS